MNVRTLFSTLALFGSFALHAQSVPTTLNYQGRLTDNGPTPAPVTATVNMQFAIYDAASAGTQLWQEPSGVGTTPVSVTGGIFSVLLGAGGVPVPATVFTGGTARWLQITANGEILAPRQKLAANGWANQSGDSAKLGGTAAAAYQLATIQTCGGGQFLSAIANGSATCATPTAVLTPPVSLSASSSSAILAAANSGAGNGLSGISGAGSGASGYNHVGVMGDSDTGYGVVGGSSTGTAGQFQINNPAGAGSAIYATTNGTGYVGYFNLTNTSSAAYALLVQSDGGGQAIYSANTGMGRAGEFRATNTGSGADAVSIYHFGTGDAVNGYAQGTSGRAGYFSVGNGSNASPAIYAAATAGPAISANSTGADGITATSYLASAAGVHGINNASAAFQTPSGVLGETTVGYGVRGIATSGATGMHATSDTGTAFSASTNNSATLGAAGYLNNISGYALQAETNFGTTGSGGTSVVRAIAGSGTNLFIGCTGNRSTCTNRFRVDSAGTVFANGGFLGSGADVAEFIASDDALEAGDVIEIDPDRDGKFRKVRTARSGAVAGVITTKPGLTMNAGDAAGGKPAGPALALAGRVPVKVTGENGPIRRGDLLVSSPTPGRAMKAPARPEPGTIIGKALGEMNSAAGVVDMLVMLR